MSRAANSPGLKVMMMSEQDDAEVERITCPQRDCGLKMERPEMVAHLKLDHNLSNNQAEAMLDYER